MTVFNRLYVLNLENQGITVKKCSVSRQDETKRAF